MLANVTLLFACQLAGEILARWTELPIPGPVLGMIILLAGLVARRRPVSAGLDAASGALLRCLLLLFVPAGVGIYAYWHMLAGALLPIAGAVIIGTVVTIGVTGRIMQALLSLKATTPAPRMQESRSEA